MTITFTNNMLIISIVHGTLDRDGLGIVIKHKSQRLPSEERGYYQGLVLGPLYIRTFSWTAAARRANA